MDATAHPPETAAGWRPPPCATIATSWGSAGTPGMGLRGAALGSTGRGDGSYTLQGMAGQGPVPAQAAMVSDPPAAGC